MSEKWEKVLYKKQKHPDNYVDPSFLSDLRKNVNLYHYTWWESITGVCCVTHEVSCTVLFVICYVIMKEDILSVRDILSLMILLTVLCFMIFQLTSQIRWTINIKEIYGYLKSGVIFLIYGYMFSPVLKTLTQTISTDTIYAMVVLMMISHVLFQDYGSLAAIVSSTLSLNSALFAAVCLSSRLPTIIHTFALMILAVIVFVLQPLMRKFFKENNFGLILITCIFFMIVVINLVYLSTKFMILYILLCFCINLLFPSLFVYCQKYKENIFGPWDEAVVKS